MSKPRRRLLRFGASAAIIGLAPKSGVMAASGEDRLVAPGGDTCTVTPQAIEGPYYDDGTKMRRDVRDGVEGLPLRLALKVVNAGSDSCPPMENMVVDIWQSDAFGAYSNTPLERQGRQGREVGIDTTGQMFLRGVQTTDEHGIVEFDTIVPGWYFQPIGNGGFQRVTHIHAKVFHEDRVAVTQLYLPDNFNDRIYREVAPYRDTPLRNGRDGREYERIHNDEDRAFSLADPLLAVAEEGNGVAASAILGWGGGVDPDEVRQVGGGRRGGGKGRPGGPPRGGMADGG